MEQFQGQVAEALGAFGMDVSYAVAVVSAAVNIRRKREIWQHRLDLRKAEQTARAQCQAGPDFICKTESPCGTGTCRFASRELRDLRVPECGGATDRPQLLATGGKYSIEAAVYPLSDLRDRRVG